MKFTLFVLCTLAVLARCTPLDDYINLPDPSYKWTLNNTIKDESYTAFIIELTSQTWMTTAESDWPLWKHWLSICVPNDVTSDTAFIYVDGGSNSNWKTPSSLDSTISLACEASGVVTVGLTQIPNQPIIFNNDGVQRIEDGLIAYTWRHFLNDTSDPIWLARLPMTKAVVKAMDAIQEFAQEIPLQINHFFIAGASKRGWVTWLAGAVDPRVIAIAPIVMPILNMQLNMGHQYQAYGGWSFALNDYIDEGVMAYLNTENFTALAAVVDPFSYIDRLTLPKYAVCSTGDEFFLPDSPQFFWNSLIGEKHLRLVPNAEHSLMGHQTDVLLSIVSFANMVIQNLTRPNFTWDIQYSADNQSATITMTLAPGSLVPTKVKVWDAVTESTTRRDFRLLTCTDPEKCVQFILWFERDVEAETTGVYSVTLSAPDKGWRGFILEAEYVLDQPINDQYTMKYTSEAAVVPNVLPFGPCDDHCQPTDDSSFAP
ncbi:PhoPQ-activated pathogenicity-related protein [Tieghemostelium lacteum]|uniref:PhoPQ-activated pathogenicity-related protein n=1 Tax=Tieghemostelium lacteum TaxID=361077 RepID=A0A152A0M0_TIELA|nr:PhoPQ-activated pathogenicity-related protein [Tieghemostelium lacteum]|eukprot:KYQ99759.1 PhoPQ-activated pathogenicity-related protein [Tieghemostelium lacteum]